MQSVEEDGRGQKENFQRLRRKKQKKRWLSIWKEVNHSKNMESIWKDTNKYRRKKRGGGANIEAKKLIQHYSKLLGGGGNQEGNKEAMEDANININQITTNK